MSYLPSVRGQDGRLLTNHNRNSTLLPSGRDSNIKMGCSIGLLILKFSQWNTRHRVPVQVKEFLNLQRLKNTRLKFVAFAVRSSIAETVQPVDQTFRFVRLTVFSAFFLYCSWIETSTMENEDNTSSYIAACVLNAFLSYTAVMLNCLTIYALTKLSSLPKTLKTRKPGFFWSGCWFDGAAFAHCVFHHDNGAKNWKQSSL